MINIEKKNNLYYINTSDKSDYRKQRDNKKDPNSTCQITAMMMGLKIKGYKPNESFDQMFDDIYSIIEEDKEIDNMYKTRYKKYMKTYTKRELHKLLSLGVNKYMGQDVTEFTSSCPLENIVYDLVNDTPSVLSGYFYKYNHVVTLVGVVVKNLDNILYTDKIKNIKLNNIDSYIIDDPYGIYKMKYNNHNGDDVIMPAADMKKIVKSFHSQSKWRHSFI